MSAIPPPPPPGQSGQPSEVKSLCQEKRRTTGVVEVLDKTAFFAVNIYIAAVFSYRRVE